MSNPLPLSSPDAAADRRYVFKLLTARRRRCHTALWIAHTRPGLLAGGRPCTVEAEFPDEVLAFILRGPR